MESCRRVEPVKGRGIGLPGDKELPNIVYAPSVFRPKSLGQQPTAMSFFRTLDLERSRIFLNQPHYTMRNPFQQLWDGQPDRSKGESHAPSLGTNSPEFMMLFQYLFDRRR